MRASRKIDAAKSGAELESGVATLELLEKLGVDVDYPFDQTCCGQPMANSGGYREAGGAARDCSAIRGLGQQMMSERPNDARFSKPGSLLERVRAVTFVDFDRHDECSGRAGQRWGCGAFWRP